MHCAMYERHAEARDCAERASAIFPSSPLNIGLLTEMLRNAGEPARAEALLAQLPSGSYGTAHARVCFHFVRGEIDAAMGWAGTAVGDRDPSFIATMIRPFEKLFRRSPEWPTLLQKINLAP